MSGSGDNDDHGTEEGTDERVQRISRSRAGYKAAVTRKRNEIRVCLINDLTHELEAKRNELQDAWDKFTNIQLELQDIVEDEDELDRYLADYENANRQCKDVMDKIHRCLSHNPSPVVVDELTPHDSASQVASDRGSGVRASSKVSKSSAKDKYVSQVAKRKALEQELKFLEQKRSLDEKRFRMERSMEEEKFRLAQEEEILRAQCQLNSAIACERVYAEEDVHDGQHAEDDGDMYRAGGYGGSPRRSTFTRRQFQPSGDFQLNALSAPFVPMHHNVPTHNTTEPASAQHDVLKAMVDIQAKQSEHLERLVSQRTNDLSSLTLPQPQVPVFDGNPLEYCMFVTAFHNLVERKTENGTSRLYYLVQYTRGEVQELLKGCLTKGGDDGYFEARRLLEKHYGQPYKIATAYVDKATNGPTIKPDDSEALRRFSVLLTSCRNTLEELNYMGKIENPDSLRRIVLRLPFDLRKRWRAKADEITERLGRDIQFKDIAVFVENEARTATHPLFGDILDKSHNRPSYKESRDGPHPKQSAVLASHTRVNTTLSHKPVIESSTTALKCILCDSNHVLVKCDQFSSKSYDERIKFCRDRKLCFNCLHATSRHRAKDCRRPNACEKCKGRHVTLLHSDDYNNVPKTALASARSDTASGKIAFPVVAVKVRVKGSTEAVHTLALLDACSNTSFCTESLLHQLGVEGKPVTFSLSTVDREKSPSHSKVVSLLVHNLEEDEFLELPDVFTREFLPVYDSDMPTQEEVDQWPHLQGIEVPRVHARVGLLIGVDNHLGLEPLEVRSSAHGGPFAVRTRMGWTINGPLSKSAQCSVHIANNVKVDEMLVQSFENFCNREFNDSKIHDDVVEMSQLDKRALDIMQSSVCLNEGHYEVSLPFKVSPPHVPNNFVLANHRLNLLKRRFAKDESMLSEYQAFMSNLFSQGYAEIVPESEIARDDGQVWYLPHHPVRHPQKGKLRVVFDCSAVYRGVSLNQQLLQGPDQTSPLLGVLLRFRQFPVAVSADIESMFLRVRVTSRQCDMLRFLWWPDGDVGREPVTCRMLVHLFGATSSPSVCSFALRQTAEDNRVAFDGDVIDAVMNNFYVDDYLGSVNEEESAVRLVHQLTQLLGLGAFRLTKWASNSVKVLEAVPELERASSVRCLTNEGLPREQVLGVYWDMNDDTLSFRVNLPQRPPTRRGILSTMSSIYDPVGYVSPVVLPIKHLLQELCRRKYAWDDPVPDDLLRVWLRWLQDMPMLAQVRFRRCLTPPGFGRVVSCALHHFSDASSSIGYGAVSYARVVNGDGEIYCSFLIGKSRVTSLKPVSVPRLELCAATVSVKLDVLLRRELEIPIQDTYFWTDSTSVLKYVRNEDKRFTTFVANRIALIREHSDPAQWMFVPGRLNPGDDASRGLSVSAFLNDERWKQGPAFLWRPQDEWIEQPEISLRIDAFDPEVKREKTTLCTDVSRQETNFITDFVERYSSLDRLKRITAWMLRFKLNASVCARDVDVSAIPPLAMKEVKAAEYDRLLCVQRKCFAEKSEALSSHEGGTVKKSLARVLEITKALMITYAR